MDQRFARGFRSKARLTRVQNVMTKNIADARRSSTDRSPLPAGSASFQTHKLVLETEKHLCLKETLGMRIFAGVFITIGVVALTLAATLFQPPKLEGWVISLIGVVFFSVGTGILLFATQRVDFDRDEGIVRFSRFGAGSAWGKSDPFPT